MYLKNKKISIVGGGLVGSLLSIYMSKYGPEISVFDKRSDLRKNINQAGRSINLALSNRGICALESLGFINEIIEISMPMYKRIMHSIDGSLTEQKYGKINQAIYSVSRHNLNERLVNIAEEIGVGFYFNHECENVNFINTELVFKNGFCSSSDYIFGADGAGSLIRKQMSKSFPDVEMTEQFIDSSYKELTISANLDDTHKLQNDALHIWPRESFMLIAGNGNLFCFDNSYNL